MMLAGKDTRTEQRVAQVRRWVESRLGRIRHETRVAGIASALVRITSGLHSLSPRDRRLLHMGSFVHDVGRCKNEKDHPTVGAEMILGKESLPLSPAERRGLAYLTRYHRGAVPPAGRDGILKKYDDCTSLYTVLAFLRAADALDCRSLESPKLSFHLRGRRLMIRVMLRDDSAKARRVFGRRKKLRLLEEVLACRIEVSIVVAGEVVAGQVVAGQVAAGELAMVA
jgi:exopolyphosphatase/guanosine-5'-triphosphate,3'-diphosphate pyrophosphatase